MDFANGPSISKAMHIKCPVLNRSPSSFIAHPKSWLLSHLWGPPGALPEAVDGELQVELPANLPAALSIRHLTVLSFAQLAWDEKNDFAN